MKKMTMTMARLAVCVPVVYCCGCVAGCLLSSLESDQRQEAACLGERRERRERGCVCEFVVLNWLATALEGR